MADPLYLSLWFPQSEIEDLMPRALAVMRQFPFSATRPGITYLSLHPVSWNEPTILGERFKPGIPPEQAVQIACDLLHEDYAYLFEAWWDLWSLDEEARQWTLRPAAVTFLIHGREFDEGTSAQQGHVQIDFGLDIPFLHEELTLDQETENRVRANVQKLVEFTAKAEKASEATARLLGSESEENLAQKLIARLQKVQ